MSTEIGKLKATGPRKSDLLITRFYGGEDAGMCVQLTSRMEDGRAGYIQLSAPDCVALMQVLRKHLITPSLELESKKAAEKMAAIQEADDILRVSYGITIEIIESLAHNACAHAMVLGSTEFEEKENQ